MNEIQNKSLIDQPERFWPQTLRWALIAFAYWVAVRLGLLFVAQPEGIASVWPASGLALAILLLHPKSQWTKLLAVIFVVNATGNWSSGNTIVVSLGFALANSLEPLLGAWVMTYFCRSKIIFESIREVMALFIVALIVNGVSALLGAAIPAIAFNAQFFKAWQLWWAADGLGIILLTPLIVSLFTSPVDIRSITARRTLEAVFLLSIMLSFAWLLFGGFTDPAHPLLRNYMVFPFVIWLAFRFRLHGMAGALLLFAAIATGYTLQNIGIFAIAGQTLSEHLISVQIYLSVTTFSGFLLNALITERNHADIVLQASEANFRNLAESAPEGILIGSSDGRHIYANRHAVEILGYSPEEILLTKQKDLADPAAYPLLKQRSEDRIAGQPVPPTYETDIRRKDGSSFRAEITGTRTSWEGEFTDLVFIRDITERKQAEQNLQKKESNLSALISNTRDRIWAVDAEYRLIINNAQFLGMIEETIEHAIGIGKSVLLEEIPQELRERWRSYYDRALGGEIFSIETKKLFTDQDLYMEYSFHPIRNLDESISGVVVSGHDITERKQAELMLRVRLDLSKFSDSHSLDELLQKTLDEAEALTVSQIGFVHFLEADQKTLLLQTWSSNTLKNMCTAEGKGQHYSVDKAGVWVDCVSTRAPVIHNDYPNLAHRKGFPEGHAPVLRELVVPVIRNDSIVMIMGVGNKPTDFTNVDVEIMSQLADSAWDIIQRKRAEQKLKINESMLAEMGITAKVGAWKVDLKTMQQTWTEEVYLIHELDLSFYPTYENGIEFYPPVSRPVIEKALQRAIENGEPFDLELEFVTARGTHKWVHVIGKKDVESNDIHGTFQDVTEQVLARDALQDSEFFIKSILNSLTAQIAVLDGQGVIVAVNEAWKKFGRENDSPDPTDYLGSNYLSACEAAIEQGDPVARRVDQGIRAVLDGTETHFSMEYPCHSLKQKRWFSVGVVPQHHSGRGVVVIHEDISNRKRAEQALEAANLALQTTLAREQELARTDPLTGIDNRRNLIDRAKHELDIAARYRQPLSVILFDLDHFKSINDTFGHTVGDHILQRITQFASAQLRSADVIGRYGGEEFIILMPMTKPEQAFSLAERIREDVAAYSMPTPKGEVSVTLSIGIVELSPVESVEEVFHRADEAMYAAKQAGRNCTRIGSK